MIRYLKAIEKYLIIFLLFLLPTQLAYHFWPGWAFVFGIRIDLLSPSIYLTDLLIILIFLLKVVTEGRKFFQIPPKYKIFWQAVIILIAVNCIYSTSAGVSLNKWFKALELVFLGIYFYKQQALKLSSIVYTLFYSSIFFSVIGITQFVKGGTIGGILYYLGERAFSQSTPGIALVSLNGAEYLRAYSTFSHPNSLAGFLGAAILFILLSGKLKRNTFNLLGILVVLTCFILTFSLSAYLGIFVAFAYYLFSKNKKHFGSIVNISILLFILVSLLLPVFSPWIFSNFSSIGQNISQRLDLAFISGQMIAQKFLTGEGLGTFIVNIPMYKGVFTYSWLLQPVHNIFLLVFAEIGIFGLLAFTYILFKAVSVLLKDKRIYLLLSLIFILFTGLFDHYTLTLQQNILLFSVFIGISFHAKMS